MTTWKLKAEVFVLGRGEETNMPIFLISDVVWGMKAKGIFSRELKHWKRIRKNLSGQKGRRENLEKTYEVLKLNMNLNFILRRFDWLKFLKALRNIVRIHDKRRQKVRMKNTRKNIKFSKPQEKIRKNVL